MCWWMEDESKEPFNGREERSGNEGRRTRGYEDKRTGGQEGGVFRRAGERTREEGSESGERRKSLRKRGRRGMGEEERGGERRGEEGRGGEKRGEGDCVQKAGRL